MAATKFAIHHVGVCVRDLDAALAQYTDLGYAVGFEAEIDDPEGARANALTAVDMRVVMLDGPGVTVELIEHRLPPHDRPALATDAPGAGDFDVTTSTLSIVSADIGASARLHERLGFARTGPATLTGAGVTVSLLEAGAGVVAGAANDIGRWHIAVDPGDVPALHAALSDEGYVFNGPPLVHESGVTWCFVRDPGGGAIELFNLA